MGRDLVRKRTPEEEREYQNSIKYERMKAKIKKTAKWLSQLQISVGYCNTLRRCLLQDSMPYLRAVDGY